MTAPRDDPRYQQAAAFEDTFDAELYANIYSSLKGSGYVFEGPQAQILKQHYNIFKTGNVKGKRLLELGAGPSINHSILAALHFDEIYLSEYLSQCRKVLTNWIEKSDNCPDFKETFEFVSQLLDKRMDAQQLESNLRSKIKGVMKCDIMLKNPIEPIDMGQFDCVMVIATFEGVAATFDLFDETVKNAAGMVKQGGHFVSSIYMNGTYYHVGKNKYSALLLTPNFIKESLAKAGLKLVSWEEHSIDPGDKSVTDQTGFATMHAIKL